jgi:hypothetical protein
MSEFWVVKYGGHVDFDCPDELINGMQKLRDFFGAMKITSTIRPRDKFGYHRTGNAIDSIPLKNTLANIKQFETECRNYINGKGSVLIESMREVGVQGFGIESGNCIHIDFRNGKNCSRSDKYGRFIIFTWDKINGSVVL